MKHIKQFLNKLKTEAVEYWTLLMLQVGLPLVAWVYVDWKLALAVFVVVNVVIGIIYLRKA